MKIYLFLFILLISGCYSQRKSIEFRQSQEISLFEYSSVKLDLFNIKGSITNLLDSIILSVNQCKLYNNYPIGYFIEFYSNQFDHELMSVSNYISPDDFDYSKCQGVFYFRGYQFVCTGELPKNSFSRIDRQITICYCKRKNDSDTIRVDKIKYMTSSWDFVILEDDFKCFHYNYCGDYWNDSTYYQGINYESIIPL